MLRHCLSFIQVKSPFYLPEFKKGKKEVFELEQPKAAESAHEKGNQRKKNRSPKGAQKGQLFKR